MSAKVQVDRHFTALGRLKARDKPINNDAVTLEAGSGRDSIKESRPAYAELIATINTATKQQAGAKAASDPIPGMHKDTEGLTRRLDQSLDREVALLHELHDPRAKAKQLAEKSRLLKLGRLVPMQ